MSEPTKLPWKYQEESDSYTHIVRGPNGEYVCSGPQGRGAGTEQDMRRVVLAVNYHQRLVDALREAELDCRGYDALHGWMENAVALLAEIDKEAANG